VSDESSGESSSEDGLNIYEDVAEYDYNNNDDDDDDDDDGGFCQPYLGLACAKFLGNGSVYVRSRFEQALMEEQFAGIRRLLRCHAAIMPITGVHFISLVIYARNVRAAYADVCPCRL